MSLVVCSNKIPDARQYDEDARHMSPNSFVNNLKQTMQIPKNSEIAVQSVKLTKTGEIELDQGNRFYSWFGRRRLMTDFRSYQQSFVRRS